MKKYTAIILSVFVLFALSASSALAHVVVKPAQVGVGAYQTFTMGVPSEKPIATTKLRLVIPKEIDRITPNVKPGWTITIKKDGTAENARVTEVIWSGGSIPANQRDEFLFSGRASSSVTTAKWEAFQTYADGSEVAWNISPDAQPKDATGAMDFSKLGPYSETNIIDDLSASETPAPNSTSSAFSIAALAISIIALVLSTRKPKWNSSVTS